MLNFSHDAHRRSRESVGPRMQISDLPSLGNCCGGTAGRRAEEAAEALLGSRKSALYSMVI